MSAASGTAAAALTTGKRGAHHLLQRQLLLVALRARACKVSAARRSRRRIDSADKRGHCHWCAPAAHAPGMAAAGAGAMAPPIGAGVTSGLSAACFRGEPKPLNSRSGCWTACAGAGKPPRACRASRGWAKVGGWRRAMHASTQRPKPNPIASTACRHAPARTHLCCSVQRRGDLGAVGGNAGQRSSYGRAGRQHCCGQRAQRLQSGQAQAGGCGSGHRRSRRGGHRGHRGGRRLVGAWSGCGSRAGGAGCGAILHADNTQIISNTRRDPKVPRGRACLLDSVCRVEEHGGLHHRLRVAGRRSCGRGCSTPPCGAGRARGLLVRQGRQGGCGRVGGQDWGPGWTPSPPAAGMPAAPPLQRAPRELQTQVTARCITHGSRPPPACGPGSW